MSDSDTFYTKLQNQLEETTKFPADYLYKFIVPNDGNQVVEIESIFDKTSANIKKKQSETGKYTSISILVKLSNAATVISYYKKAEKIKGIVSL